MTKKAQEAYMRGFCKAAEAYGVDLQNLIKVAQELKANGQATAKSRSSDEYVKDLRDFVPKDDIDDDLAREYGGVLHKNNDLFQDEYRNYKPQHHHFNWLWRPKTARVQKLIHAFEKVRDKLPEDKKDKFMVVANKLVDKLNKKTSPFPIFPSYTYTPDEGGAKQFGFIAL